MNLHKLFEATDATQIEINPLAETDDGRVLWCARVASAVWLYL